MRLFLLVIFLFSTFLFSQTNTKKIDSVNYYIELVNFHKKNNSYQESLLYSQKAVANAIQLKDQKKIAASYSNLNSIYTDLRKYNDSLQNKNNESLLIAKENKSQLKAKRFSKLVSILAISLISILSLLSLVLYKNNIIRNRSNNLLTEKNKELEIAKDIAEKATKSRTEFLSTVSHELRTPLNAINGITHLLLEENPNKSQMKYLKSLQFSGNYLLAFINDILEINRIESQNIPIERIDFDLKLLLQNIQDSLKEIALENNNSFEIIIDDTIPKNLIGDPTKLSQIFMNLINNSLKFTKKGFVKVLANMNTIEDNKISISFKVIDNGIGIPEDKQETIFESFSQGSIEINRKYGGTGLGLAIVKKLIDLLGGTIYLNSKVGLGSTFSFELPFDVSDTEVVPIEKQNYNEKIIFDKKILLVEDNKINQMITKKMLENKGMFCKIVDNGEDSVTLLKEENDFDLVLMDVHLPGINGTIATQQIREFNSKIPIIALTAISLNENREMLISYGMTDVITKPFEPDTFYQIIARYLS